MGGRSAGDWAQRSVSPASAGASGYPMLETNVMTQAEARDAALRYVLRAYLQLAEDGLLMLKAV